MKSSSGARYVALDHVRALAAFLVFSWHFLRFGNTQPLVQNEFVPAFPFSVVDEGHTGVALFMVLSGYLFAKLLDQKSVAYRPFFWNRFVRLAPLLVVVLLIVAGVNHANGISFKESALATAKGLITSDLPNGAWSIIIEAHFYIVLPLLIWMLRRSVLWMVGVLLLALCVRGLLHHLYGEVQSFSYFTIVGRIDQFVLGMIAWPLRRYFTRQHLVALLTAIAFTLFYWHFDTIGGFRQNPSYPSPDMLWIVLPTIEGVAYAILVAWYDNSFAPSARGVSGFVGRIGEYSYSIYLLHVFFTGRMVAFLQESGAPIQNFYICVAWSLVFFLLMMIPGYLSYRFIESPFLRLRKPYLTGRCAAAAAEDQIQWKGGTTGRHLHRLGPPGCGPSDATRCEK